MCIVSLHLLSAQEFAAKGSFIQYGGVVDHALVVRGISTVYNTDYITDFTFRLNGAIEVRAHKAAPKQARMRCWWPEIS
jgi:hypothetical protein